MKHIGHVSRWSIFSQHHCIFILACSTCSGPFQLLVCLDISSVTIYGAIDPVHRSADGKNLRVAVEKLVGC